MAQQKVALPYGTYGMLKSTVERFQKSTVPGSLNRHVLDDLSGGDLSALLTALRFLGLMNEDKTVTTEFHKLVEARKASEKEYQIALLKLLEAAYRPIIGGLNISNTTLPDVEKVFREASGFQGQMLTKAIRFYVKAMEDSNVHVSEFVTKPRPKTNKPKSGNTSKKTKAVKANALKPDIETKQEFQPDGFDRLPIPGLDNAFIQYPKNLTDGDCTMFETMVGVLRTYVKSRTGGEGKKP
ncbi:MAG TPA: hypothetical protein VGQ41_13635 [Pyrinomonadaceae bacterium]|jgi:hypothetical protein|nr:hypothetical protein [Pyrinomonadaceae bacterium]